MTLLEGFLFATLIVMVFAWFAGLRRLSRLMRERHVEKYVEMELEDLSASAASMFGERENSVAVRKLLRFLWRRDYHRLGDREVGTLGAYLRLLFLSYLVVFALLFGSIARDALRTTFSRETVAPTPPAQALRDKAFALHRQQKYADSVAAYDQLLGEVGADAELVYYRGAAHWHLGDLDAAQRDFRRTIELDPGNYEAHVHIDRMLSREKRFDECVQLWNAYLKVVPRDANAYLERAGSHFHRGDRESSLRDAKRSCELGKEKACEWVARLEPARR